MAWQTWAQGLPQNDLGNRASNMSLEKVEGFGLVRLAWTELSSSLQSLGSAAGKMSVGMCEFLRLEV